MERLLFAQEPFLAQLDEEMREKVVDELARMFVAVFEQVLDADGDNNESR